MTMQSLALNSMLEAFFQEDDLSRNFAYVSKLPTDMVTCTLKLKDDMILAGLPFFFETFNFLLEEKLPYQKFLEFEGKRINRKDQEEIHFDLPFNVVLTGERIALNLLQRASAIATYTQKYVEKAKKYNIEILDTRKTTPGHRMLEKYAVQVGGGKNHRFGQADSWMIKDNHKSFFGGLKEALDFFSSVNSFYNPVILEIHNIEELKQAMHLNVKHFLLDNFSPKLIQDAIKLKNEGVTYEISGGINLANLDDYLFEGVDAISSGSLTYNAPHVDISLKYKKASM
jgi:nicotinate-nucleotide pyrophosphorylase (carboxylating)